MRINQGGIERLVRALLGAPTAVSYVYIRHFHLYLAFGLLAFGVVLLATAFIGFCPVHQLCGTSTAKRVPEVHQPT
jgi:hypothetical protein